MWEPTIVNGPYAGARPNIEDSLCTFTLGRQTKLVVERQEKEIVFEI
jgi:hypothetical protein